MAEVDDVDGVAVGEGRRVKMGVNGRHVEDGIEIRVRGRRGEKIIIGGDKHARSGLCKRSAVDGRRAHRAGTRFGASERTACAEGDSRCEAVHLERRRRTR